MKLRLLILATLLLAFVYTPAGASPGFGNAGDVEGYIFLCDPGDPSAQNAAAGSVDITFEHWNSTETFLKSTGTGTADESTGEFSINNAGMVACGDKMIITADGTSEQWRFEWDCPPAAVGSWVTEIIWDNGDCSYDYDLDDGFLLWYEPDQN